MIENGETVERKLTLKQRRFVNEYVANDGNGYQAAVKAGYTGDEGTLRQTASQNLTKPHIAAAIRAAEHDATVAAGVTAEWIKRMLVKVAKQATKVQKVYDKHGNEQEITDANGAARALELLGRASGIFEADNRQSRPKVSIRNFSGSKQAADSSDD